MKMDKQKRHLMRFHTLFYKVFVINLKILLYLLKTHFKESYTLASNIFLAVFCVSKRMVIIMTDINYLQGIIIIIIHAVF